MGKQIIGGIFHVLLLSIIGFVYFAAGIGMLSILNETDIFNIGNMGSLVIWIFAVIIEMGVLTWIFSNIQHYLSGKQGYVYWGFTFAFSLILLILGLQKKLIAEDKVFMGAFIYHFTLISFLIPKMDGTTYYLHRELVIYEDSITFRAWISKSYTPGCILKLLVETIVAVIIAAIYTYWNVNFLWVVFLIEGGMGLVYCFADIKCRFF